MRETMDFPIAKSSLQTIKLAPWANLYITQHTQISIGTIFLYLVSCFPMMGFKFAAMWNIVAFGHMKIFYPSFVIKLSKETSNLVKRKWKTKQCFQVSPTNQGQMSSYQKHLTYNDYVFQQDENSQSKVNVLIIVPMFQGMITLQVMIETFETI